MNKTCILCFAKYPREGEVKTRLAKGIGFKKATELYSSFVEQTWEQLKTLEADTVLCYSPEKDKDLFSSWLKASRMDLQVGEGLGEKLEYSFLRAFAQGFQSVLVMGTDSPDLPVEYLNKAIDCLKEEEGVVLGPTSDGGYYCLGFTRDSFSPEVFREMEWSVENVYKETMKRLKGAGKRVVVLPEWHDIDTAEDLELLDCRVGMSHVSSQ